MSSLFLKNIPATKMRFFSTGEDFKLDLNAEIQIALNEKHLLIDKKTELLEKLKKDPHNHQLLEDLYYTLNALVALGYPQNIKIKNNQIMYQDYVIDHIDMVGA